MIIINQNKEQILNFDKAHTLWARSQNDGWKVINDNGTHNIHLGDYSTKERAKEIIEEIAIAYNRCECYRTGRLMTDVRSDTFIYRMPQY